MVNLSVTLQTNHVESSGTTEPPTRKLFYELQLLFQKKSSAPCLISVQQITGYHVLKPILLLNEITQ